MTELLDDVEILFRQIHPNFIQDGLISSQPFRPTPKDDGKLSVDRETITTASDAFELFVASGGNSVAVCGLSVGEFRQENLLCYADPIKPSDGCHGNKAHAVADYSGDREIAWKNKAKRLKIKATARGILHSHR